MSIIENRKARFEYEIHETLEAGIVLLGTEVKSLKKGNANIVDGYIILRRGEPWLLNVNISAYDKAFKGINHEPRRDRKLLLHKNEISKLFGKMANKGFAIIPLNFHFKRGKIKLDIAIAKGKKLHDKRADLKKRDLERDARMDGY